MRSPVLLTTNAEIAIILNSVGRAYHSWGRYLNALDYFQQALTIAQQLGRDAHIARSLNNIGLVYHSWGQCDEALAHYEQALALNRQLGRSTAILGDLNHIGRVYESCKGYAKALEHFRQALTLARQFGRDADIAQNLDSLGEVYYALQQYPEAISYLEESVEIKEHLRKTAKGDVRRDYLASQIYSYEFLTSCYVRTDDLAHAFETIELSRARRLAEQLAGSDATVKIPSLTHIRETLSENMAILIYADIDLPDIVELLITKEQVLIVALSKSTSPPRRSEIFSQAYNTTSLIISSSSYCCNTLNILCDHRPDHIQVTLYQRKKCLLVSFFRLLYQLSLSFLSGFDRLLGGLVILSCLYKIKQDFV